MTLRFFRTLSIGGGAAEARQRHKTHALLGCCLLSCTCLYTHSHGARPVARGAWNLRLQLVQHRSLFTQRTCAVVGTPLQLIMPHPALATLLHSVTLAALMTHEIDAALRHEWRVLPFTRFLPERAGRRVFVWLHLPIYAAAIAWDAHVRAISCGDFSSSCAAAYLPSFPCLLFGDSRRAARGISSSPLVRVQRRRGVGADSTQRRQRCTLHRCCSLIGREITRCISCI